jgi:hypothetical protein
LKPFVKNRIFSKKIYVLFSIKTINIKAMKNKIIITTALMFLALIGTFSYAKAAIVPTLSLSYILNNNLVSISVYADPNAAVQLYYLNNSSFIGTVGYTNNSGYFYTTVNSNYYNIPINDEVYVIVDGASSNDASWPNYNYNTYPVYLSQNNLSVAVGQSASITISGGYNNNYYLSSSSPLVNASINGNVLNVYGNTAGSATLAVCSNNSSCSDLYVTVYNNTSYSQPTLSQNNIYMYVGQNRSLNIYGNGSYYISNNSNSSVASASINGSIISVYAYAVGSSNITVCQNGGSCTNLYVSVANNPPAPITTTQYYHFPRWPYPFFRRMGRFFRI